MRILITGGAGFIGAATATAAAAAGDDVTILDSLSPQIHGPDAVFPEELAEACHCVAGDVRDVSMVANLMKHQDSVLHLAAETGTGQSMYDARRYFDVNVGGTAAFMESIGSLRSHRPARLVVASSRAVYGEGQYHCERDGTVYPRTRFVDDLAAGNFEPRCPICGGAVNPEPTLESAPFAPTSVYGLTKQSQEQLTLMVAGTFGLDAVALRYQNVYGPGQSLINPYTGILATFSNLARQGRDLNVFEDGLESRDFVFIDDIVSVNLLCLHGDAKVMGPLNVGSGVATPVVAVAEAIVRHFGGTNEIRVSGDFRVGDIRHAFADTRAMQRATGGLAATEFGDGLDAFLLWAETHAAGQGYDQSISELRQRGLLRGTR